MALLRSLVTLVVVGGFAIFGVTVPIGEHTLFGHVQRIWNAEETRELVRSVSEESAPALERVKRGVKAGLDEAAKGELASPDAPTVPPANEVPLKLAPPHQAVTTSAMTSAQPR